MRIRDFYARLAYYRPGEKLTFRTELESSSPGQAIAELTVRRPGGPSWSVSQKVDLNKGLTTIDSAVAVPKTTRHGYLADLGLQVDGQRLHAAAAADVLRSWADDPRYGFLSEFSPDDAGIEDRVARSSRFHLNCLQLYDWMYRHYRLLPPRERFTDALGRRLSLNTVRRAVHASHRYRMAALAYAAVYAAEPEFFRRHPKWGLFRPDGSSYTLGDLFHLMDVAPDSSWARLMLSDLRRTRRVMGFDGFHLDQYGFPRVAFAADGSLRDLAGDFARFVDAAGGDALVIFNCVNGWPIEQIARRREVATYVEVWPPHETYADLVAIIRRCHDLAPRKPVILAAYASFLKKRHPSRMVEHGLATLSAVIFGAGAWHLLLGEGERALTDPYYPKHVELPAAAVRKLRRYYDFAVGYGEFLRDPSLRDLAATFVDGAESSFKASLPYSSAPKAGRIWAGVRTRPGWVVISLVNLLEQTDLRWDRARTSPRTRTVKLWLPNETAIRQCLVATPDGDGSLAPVVRQPDGRTIEVPLSTWTLVLLSST